MGSVIEISDLDMVYRHKDGVIQALTKVNVEAERGEFISVVGPSGCGKTTVMKILAGLLQAAAGAVKVNGVPVKGPNPNVGIVFQNPVLLAWRTVLQNIMLQVEVRKLDFQKYQGRARELISMVGIYGFEHCYPYQLSGGMQQRASICRALVHDPPLLLMDEPFGALDAITREQMNLELQRIWMESKKTVFLITHSISEAVFLSDRVYVMSCRPGTILRTLFIDLPRPRTFKVMESPAFSRTVGEIRELLQTRE